MADPELPLVLVAEDEEGVRAMLGVALRAAGYRSLLCVDGREALERLEGGAGPDIVLLDVRMPRMGGVELTQRIRSEARWDRIHLVAMSAYTDESQERQIKAAGADAFLPKPFTIADLRLVLTSLPPREHRPLRQPVGLTASPAEAEDAEAQGGAPPQLSQLGSMLFPFGLPKEKRVMAFLTAYLDDGQTPGIPSAVTVAGFVALYDDWDAFVARWHEAVASMGLSRWDAREAEALTGEFAGWTPARRDSASRVLHEILEGVPGLLGAAAVVPTDHFEAASSAARARFGSAYGLASHMVFANLGRNLANQGFDADAWVAYVSNHPGPGHGYGQVAELFAEVHADPELRGAARLSSITSSDPLDAVPLQVANIVAHEVAREWARHGADRSRYRFSFPTLGRLLRVWQVADPAFIRRLNEDHERALYLP